MSGAGFGRACQSAQRTGVRIHRRILIVHLPRVSLPCIEIIFNFFCLILIVLLLFLFFSFTLFVCFFLQQFFSIWNNIAFASAFLPLRFLARYANVSIIVGPTVLCRRLFIVTFFLPNTNRCSHLPIYTHRAISIRFRILNSRRHM